VEVTWREAKLMTFGERPGVGGNPWLETKVEIFGVMLRSR
jgi:hypothetical protein